MSKGYLTIEKVLQDKKVFDLSVAFEKTGVENGETRWNTPGGTTGPFHWDGNPYT